MRPNDSINEISVLLNKLDGVSVVDVYQTVTHIRIYLTIESFKSYHWLVYCSEGANIPLHCCCKYDPESKQILNNPALGLIYEYEITKHESDIEEFESLRFFGAQLVWLMHRMGEMKADEANRLLELWNALKVEERQKITQRVIK